MPSLVSWFRRYLPASQTRRSAKIRRRRAQPRLEILEDRCLLTTFATTYTVTSLADTNTGSGDAGTLRYVLDQANTNHTGTAANPDLIQFAIPDGGGTIHVDSANGGGLALNNNEVAVIDATTETGYSGTPLITLDGTNAGSGVNGLTISGGSSTVKGLAIVNFAGNGIQLDTNGNNQVFSCYIGLTAAGAAAANRGNGLFIDDTSGNTIGSAATGTSNVISANGENGILISGAHALDNEVVANFIGTDATGKVAHGNTGNGIRITDGARLNTIGGNTPTVSGDPPVPTAFVGKPPDGNVISANGGNGVLLDNCAEYNTLSGNFIGTDINGTAPLGNALDGVAIVDADNNSLIGTTFPQTPFIYLNLVCANGGNGLRIDNSNNTTVQADSFGLADDNSSALGNALDGVLIEGTSTNTQFGGVIPLGNICSGNGKNGLEIADSASGTVVFNMFCGLPAFVDKAVPNAGDGILISSTGGNNLIRTSVVSGNSGNGIHITGDANGVQVSEVIIGMNTDGKTPLANGGDGVLIDGNAHDNVIGGTQASIILQNTISSNGGNGIAIVGNAHDNRIFNSFIGTNITGTAAYGNAGAGVLIGGNAQNNVLGGTADYAQNLISGNLGGGIVMNGTSSGTQVIGNLIGTDRTGQNALGNIGNGITITSSNNRVGGPLPGMGNVIAFNTQNGVAVDTGTSNALLSNSIFQNAAQGIVLVNHGNDDQSAPVLTGAAQQTSTTVQITGVITAAANTTYTLDFFASPPGTPPGQGQTFLGSIGETTNANGVATYTFNSPVPTLAGASFTATATDPANNTSRFSNVVFVQTPPSPPAPPAPPAPPPAPLTPIGRLVPFGFGFGPGFQMEVFDVDAQGRVFAQPLGAMLFGGIPTFINSDLIFSRVQLVDGLLLGLLQAQGGQQDLVGIVNLINPFAFNAVLMALMRPV